MMTIELVNMYEYARIEWGRMTKRQRSIDVLPGVGCLTEEAYRRRYIVSKAWKNLNGEERAFVINILCPTWPHSWDYWIGQGSQDMDRFHQEALDEDRMASDQE